MRTDERAHGSRASYASPQATKERMAGAGAANAVARGPARLARRALPSVQSVLKQPAVAALAERFGRALVTDGVRCVLARARQDIEAGHAGALSAARWTQDVEAWIAAERTSTLKPVINATGVLLHTNLGRAPLSPAALEAVRQVASGYAALEYDLHQGARADRYGHCRRQLQRLTGAQDALVVNNNAAALFLVLSALCRDREVLISRGQLVEIGGGFRILDILQQSGARLIEVGSTNRTYARDYRDAWTPETAAVLSVHASNYRQLGYVHQPSIAELAALVRERNAAQDAAVFLMHDLGSGYLLSDPDSPFAAEYGVRRSVADGADLTAFSADKLLGGPQAGIVAGRQDLVRRLLRHPLLRTVRVDKMTLAALGATLELYMDAKAATELPLLVLGRQSVAALRQRADRLVSRLEQTGIAGRAVDVDGVAGGGSLPDARIPSVAVALSAGQAQTWADRLRAADPPVIVRRAQDEALLDLRTVFPHQDESLFRALAAWRPS